jgi:hypothetical protein
MKIRMRRIAISVMGSKLEGAFDFPALFGTLFCGSQLMANVHGFSSNALAI